MRSIHLIGKDQAEEWRLVESLGGSPHRFFQLAQRIAWGLTQPDLIRVDVIDTARRLVGSHGGAFPAHLYSAWVWRSRDPDRAARDLERARALAPVEHPLLHLLPTDQDWLDTEGAPQTVHEVVAGRIWRVEHGFAMAGAPWHSRSTATVIRTSSGDVAIVNPVALDEATAARIAALGTVRWVISQGKAHSAFVDVVRRRFRGSLAIGTEGHLRHAPASHVTFDGVLGNSRLPDELEILPIAGHIGEEVLILDRPSKTLISQDLFGMTPDDAPFVGKLYGFAFGATLAPIAFLSYSLVFWQNMPALHASLSKVRDSGFERLLGAHGGLTPRDGDVDMARGLIDHALGIGKLTHKAMLARYFASQPGFLRDLIRYLEASKGKRGAQLRASTAAD